MHVENGMRVKDRSGARARIVNVNVNRVQVVHGDTGEREWFDREDFTALYREEQRAA